MQNKRIVLNTIIFIFFILLLVIGIIAGFYYGGIDYFAYYFSLPFYLIAEKATSLIVIPVYAVFMFAIIKTRDKLIYKINLIFLVLNVAAFLLTITFANLWGIAITKLFVGN